MTKRQKQREQLAQDCDKIAEKFLGGKSQVAKELRAINRRIEKRKGNTK